MKVGDLVLCKNAPKMPPGLVTGIVKSDTGMVLFNVLVRGSVHLFGRSQLSKIS